MILRAREFLGRDRKGAALEVELVATGLSKLVAPADADGISSEPTSAFSRDVLDHDVACQHIYLNRPFSGRRLFLHQRRIRFWPQSQDCQLHTDMDDGHERRTKTFVACPGVHTANRLRARQRSMSCGQLPRAVAERAHFGKYSLMIVELIAAGLFPGINGRS
jgi:hypothetical protein